MKKQSKYVFYEKMVREILIDSEKPLNRKEISRLADLSVYVVSRTLNNLILKNQVFKRADIKNDCRSNLFYIIS